MIKVSPLVTLWVKIGQLTLESFTVYFSCGNVCHDQKLFFIYRKGIASFIHEGKRVKMHMYNSIKLNTAL